MLLPLQQQTMVPVDHWAWGLPSHPCGSGGKGKWGTGLLQHYKCTSVDGLICYVYLSLSWTDPAFTKREGVACHPSDIGYDSKVLLEPPGQQGTPGSQCMKVEGREETGKRGPLPLPTLLLLSPAVWGGRAKEETKLLLPCFSWGFWGAAIWRTRLGWGQWW